MTDGTARRLLCTDKLSDRWKKVWEIKRRERPNTNPCGGVEMWDILRGADWNAHSCLSCTEIPGLSPSCPLKTECWAPGLVGTLFSSFNTPFKHRLSSRELFSPRLLFSFQNEVQCSLHPAMAETGCLGRQWEWRKKNVRIKNKNKNQTIGQKIKRMINSALLLNVWLPSAQIWLLAWIVRIEFELFSFCKCSHDQHINRLHVIKMYLKLSKMRIHTHTHTHTSVKKCARVQ